VPYNVYNKNFTREVGGGGGGGEGGTHAQIKRAGALVVPFRG